MEKTILSTKRKKRKTRKCLDEIRNRSRRIVTNEESITEKCDKVLKNNTTKSNNHLITMNRLTLAMSRKAVKSETITRSQLANLKQKPSIFIRDVVQGVVIESSGNSTNTTEPNVENINTTSACDNKCQISLEYCSGNTDKVSPVLKYSLGSPKTPGSVVLFSPTTKLSTPLQMSETNVSTSLSSITSQEITTGANLYYEIMDEVQIHFKRLAATMVHEDVIWKSKEKLRKLYIESRQREYEDNIMNCIRSNITPNRPDSPGIERTKLNIRNDTSPDEKLDFLKEYSVSLSDSPECEFSEVHRSSDSEDRLSLSSPCMLFSPPKQSISNTPEYIFYPHRLNN